RRDDRTSRAGFPTKVVESLAVGTPVICNHTGDLAEHVRDGQEGLVCENATPAELARVIGAAINLPRDQRAVMRRLSRRQAELAFDFRSKQSDLAEFFGTRLRGAR
ncbi:MAG TPA: glycosyltransferase, partial [Reyranellaceae bacterium]|nr:glycosyltransferase [Reyranellaceae bacterium]